MSLARQLPFRAFCALTFALTANAQSPHSPRADLTVTPAWLAEHLKDPNLVLLHVGDRKEYDQAHIAGARFVSMQDVSVSNHDHDTNTGLMLEMPTADSLRKQLQALGISDNSRVVVYYGNDWVSPSTRIIFTLDYAGLGSRSVLLDGGMNAWKETGHAVTAEVPAARTGQLSALRIKPIVVDADYVKANLRSPSFHLIDGRGAVFYDGVKESGPRNGHVAGAKNIPFNEVTDDKLHFKSPAELEALFTKAGVGPNDTVVAYCHIGQQATAVLFAARTLGHPVLLYDGSYQDWSRRNTEFPVENPAEGAKKQ
ncbi:MAG: rhodanese-like domain-containing protein [Gemmatimonadota bacterium]|nr:rhodanese-like domain-containing protein [Gemmatimonadota bacterium]